MENIFYLLNLFEMGKSFEKKRLDYGYVSIIPSICKHS
jgi:hypothetical protein